MNFTKFKIRIDYLKENLKKLPFRGIFNMCSCDLSKLMQRFPFFYEISRKIPLTNVTQNSRVGIVQEILFYKKQDGQNGDWENVSFTKFEKSKDQIRKIPLSGHFGTGETSGSGGGASSSSSEALSLSRIS
jgi:hypothetical protein